MKIITVDPGKFATKAIVSNTKTGEKGTMKFLTKSYKVPKDSYKNIEGNTFFVEIDGEKYFVGDQGERVEYGMDKATDTHKLAVYVAITQFMDKDYKEKGDYEDINLVLGCPVSIFKSEERKRKYKEFISNGKEVVNIRVNQKFYSFRIKDVLLLPEGCGFLFAKSEDFENRRIAVLDLGGLNLNFGVYENLVPVVSSMFTSNLGGNDIEVALCDELSSKYGKAFDTSEIRDIIKNKGVRVMGKIDPESQSIIRNKLKDQVAKIMEEANKHNVDLALMDIVFVGGTSQLLREEILRELPHAIIPDDPEWANAVGFSMIGAMKYEERQ